LVRSLAVDAIPFGRWVYYAAWLKPQNFVVCVSAVGAHATDVYQERYDLTRAVLSELSFTNKVREDECAMEDVMRNGGCHGIWSWTIALVARHSATDHHFARDIHASLKRLSTAGLKRRSN
jgi:hypothetical protein